MYLVIHKDEPLIQADVINRRKYFVIKGDIYRRLADLYLQDIQVVQPVLVQLLGNQADFLGTKALVSAGNL